MTLATRPLGSTGLKVTELCVGTSPLASMARLYGYDVSDERAVATIEAVLASPIRFIDTSNGYGEHGEAEKRIGLALAKSGGLPADVVLATKVDPDPITGDFSGKRVFASYEESLVRLGVDRVPLLYLHDPERIPFEEAVAPGGAVEALVQLRQEGRVDQIGVAGGPVQLLAQYLDTGNFDVLLSHNRYTLLDRSAEPLFASAHERGIGVVNAAPFGGGMLAKGPDVQSKYGYGERDEQIADAARAMGAACARHGFPLAAAALQFSLRAPFIDATVVGVSSPERVGQTLEYAALEIPEALWAELETLVPPSECWLN
ncbi:aldo/keto reductase [Sinomonas terrae]|uniref:Aldo/keto reductase n=1 Tax=Sinomonas terrae TaxID=2908838 RepID=A0ABS9TVV4_9MICC|nr:aldo/keto reductase [Sinomonas terrae]MCH6468549.1 aldo/keto reductase [Sinomonas terrae]